jgi:kynureninase
VCLYLINFLYINPLYLSVADKTRTDPDSDSIYFCGHSLGLQPKRVRKWIDTWLRDWADL